MLHRFLVSCVREIALDDLMVIACQLRWPELEGELVELSGKAERHLVILIVYGCTRVDAHVEGFVDGCTSACLLWAKSGRGHHRPSYRIPN